MHIIFSLFFTSSFVFSFPRKLTNKIDNFFLLTVNLTELGRNRYTRTVGRFSVKRACRVRRWPIQVFNTLSRIIITRIWYQHISLRNNFWDHEKVIQLRAIFFYFVFHIQISSKTALLTTYTVLQLMFTWNLV